MTNPATLPKGYIAISDSYSYAPLRVGLSLRNALGAEVYVQPGDDESAMRETIEALSDYFAGSNPHA